jgi:hypothetical protein
MRNRQTARTLGVFAILVVCSVAGRGTSAAARDESLTVFLDLPTTNGFSDATQALVETKDLVRERSPLTPTFAWSTVPTMLTSCLPCSAGEGATSN